MGRLRESGRLYRELRVKEGDSPKLVGKVGGGGGGEGRRWVLEGEKSERPPREETRKVTDIR